MPSIPADSIRSPRATDEVVAMLFSTSAPWPSPRTTPSSPVRAIRAPAAAEASSRSCARETPRPTVTTRPTSPAGTASGEPGATPSDDPAPISALWAPARCSSSRIGTLPQRRREGPNPLRASRRSSALCRASARRRKSSRSRASSSRRSRSFSVARREELDGPTRPLPDTPCETAPTAAASGRRQGQDPGLQHRPATAPRRRLGRQDQDAGHEHGREHGAAPAGVDGGDLDAGVLGLMRT